MKKKCVLCAPLTLASLRRQNSNVTGHRNIARAVARSFVVKLVFAGALIPGASHAMPPASTSSVAPSGMKPWTVGVTPAQRAAAEALLAEGNQHFVAAAYRQALAKYHQALERYDHPAVHFNIARTLINLDRPTEAFESIEAALRYGAEPLKHLYQEAKNYHRLLGAQVAEVELRCRQPGVAVTMDGARVLGCPGQTRLRLRPGNHQIVARLPGYLTLTRDVVVLPGPSKPVDLHLRSIDEATMAVRPYSAWKPWAVVAGGLALVGFGTVMQLEARSNRDDYQALLSDDCSLNPCPETGRLAALWDDARRNNAISISSLAVGGAVVATGVTFLFMNRARTVVRSSSDEPSLEVLPTISDGSVGAVLLRHF